MSVGVLIVSFRHGDLIKNLIQASKHTTPSTSSRTLTSLLLLRRLPILLGSRFRYTRDSVLYLSRYSIQSLVVEHCCKAELEMGSILSRE